MATIPASALVDVVPNVLSAGGNALVLNGLVLTLNTRVPAGQVLSFPNDGISVASFFGAGAEEVTIANTYFAGFDTSTQKPQTILFAQYNAGAVAAYLRGGKASQLTLAQLKGISGTIDIVMDGYTYSAADLDLSSATSFSAAAALIETALNGTLPSAASVTGAIAAGTASVTGSIAGNILTVTAVGSGTLVPGAILTGTGVSSSTQITSQLSGEAGGVGTYAVSILQNTPSTTIGATYGTLTVSAVASGTLSVGQTLSGSGVTARTQITGLGTGEGLTGTYFVQTSQTAASTTITATGTALSVTYDSVSGGFVITSGITGAPSSAGFATGTTAADLFLTSATGATLSQGAAAAVPGPFMTAITQVTQNWATFMTMFDPDDGAGTAQKLEFAEWVNTTNKRFVYVAWDTDITPTESDDASASFGNIVMTDALNGTVSIWDANNGPLIAAFNCGIAASIDFDAVNGRVNFAFRGQAGLIAGVTDETTANNLITNGYNFYGAYATANQQFVEYQNGTISGEFEWEDSYVNQIWFNNQLQLALMVLLQQVNSIPYNQAGYAMIKAACMDPINAALLCGVIRVGVTLSSLQAAEINAAAGTKVSDVLQVQGWYLQVQDASPQVRQARQSPPMNLWYLDGQSVNKLVLNSTLVQ